MVQTLIDGEAVSVPPGCEARSVHVFDRWTGGEDLWVGVKCTLPWCERCEPLRQFALQRRIQTYLAGHRGCRWRFVTISVANSTSFPEAKASLGKTWKWFYDEASRAVKVGKSHPFLRMKAYIGWKEVTFSAETGFNIHIHMFLGTTGRFSWTEVHEAWDRAAGHPAHWHESPLTSVDEAIGYVAKYASGKGFYGGLSQAEAYRYAKHLKGWNRLFTKRGTVVPKAVSGFQMCCSGVHGAGFCNGEARTPITED